MFNVLGMHTRLLSQGPNLNLVKVPPQRSFSCFAHCKQHLQ